MKPRSIYDYPVKTFNFSLGRDRDARVFKLRGVSNSRVRRALSLLAHIVRESRSSAVSSVHSAVGDLKPDINLSAYFFSGAILTSYPFLACLSLDRAMSSRTGNFGIARRRTEAFTSGKLLGLW